MPVADKAVGAALLTASMNSFVFDFVARQCVGGTHLNFFILKQLPIPPPSAFQSDCLWSGSESLAAWMLPRVLELTYTAADLKGFALDIGYNGAPFVWDEERRLWLRAELDAGLFHLYGIELDDVDYIMETFPIVKRREIAAHGSYRTKDAILAIYREMAQAHETGTNYQTKLSPPAANGWVPPALPTLRDYVGPGGDPHPEEFRNNAEAKHQFVAPKSNSAVAQRPAPNLFESPVATLFDGNDEEVDLIPTPTVIGRASVNGQSAEVLEIVKLDAKRTQYQVILESIGELKTFVSPPAFVTIEQ